MVEQAKLLTAKYRNSPYRIGYFSDNEVGWWDGALFLFYGREAGDELHQAALDRDAA